MMISTFSIWDIWRTASIPNVCDWCSSGISFQSSSRALLNLACDRVALSLWNSRRIIILERLEMFLFSSPRAVICALFGPGPRWRGTGSERDVNCPAGLVITRIDWTSQETLVGLLEISQAKLLSNNGNDGSGCGTPSVSGEKCSINTSVNLCWR